MNPSAMMKTFAAAALLLALLHVTWARAQGSLM
jgi:hypothetical protein